MIDGIVVDLSTAFYMRDAQTSSSPRARSSASSDRRPSLITSATCFELDNPLVDCVNSALAQLKSDGTYQAILDTWINTGEDVPFLK